MLDKGNTLKINNKYKWLKNDQSKGKAHYRGENSCQAPKHPHFYPQLLWKTVEKSKR